MTFRKWNSEWEKPDPLRGRRGWSRHHYAAVGVAAAVLLAAFAVIPPAVVRARQEEAALDRGYKELHEVMGAAMTADARGAIRLR